MSWAYRIVGDAVADLRALDIWLQEEVLDELERLCVDPPRPRSPAEQGEVIVDFERTAAGVRHVVFMRLRREEPKSILIVLGIASHARVVAGGHPGPA